jgi:hypothetical protein
LSCQCRERDGTFAKIRRFDFFRGILCVVFPEYLSYAPTNRSRIESFSIASSIPILFCILSILFPKIDFTFYGLQASEYVFWERNDSRKFGLGFDKSPFSVLKVFGQGRQLPEFVPHRRGSRLESVVGHPQRLPEEPNRVG